MDIKLNKSEIILIIFFIIYFFLLTLKTPKDLIADEPAHAMDSFFYYNLIKDMISNPRILYNLKDYIFRFYAYYPALYIIYYPPLFGVLSSLLFFFFGINQFAARLTSMMFSILSLITMYYLGKELYNKKIGILSIAVLAFAPYFFIFSGLIMLDIPLLFFILLCILFFYKGVEKDNKYLYYLSVVFGLGFLIKLEIIVLIFPFFAYLFYRKKMKEKLKFFLKASCCFFIIIVPFLIIFFIFKGFETLTTWIVFEKYYVEFFKHILYYSVIFYEIFPLIFLIPIFYFLWQRKFKKEDTFLIFIIMSYFIFFTLLPSKNTKYIIPSIPLFSILFVSVLTRVKCCFRFIFIMIFIAQIIITLFFPPYYTIENVNNADLEQLSKYLNENVVENGTIFLLPYLDETELIFNFVRLNNFQNHVFRSRDCVFKNMTVEDFEEFVNENNIYFIVLSEGDRSYPYIREWINRSFEMVDTRGDLLIYRNYKQNFNRIERVCQYNCRIQTEVCYNFKVS